MAQLIVDIPNDKLYLLVDAVRDRLDNPVMTSGEVQDWLENWLRERIKIIAKTYQEEVYISQFVFTDPTAI